MVEKLDEELEKFARRRLEASRLYLIRGARQERAREEGPVRSQAVLVAGRDQPEGWCCLLGVELAKRESQPSGREFLGACASGDSAG